MSDPRLRRGFVLHRRSYGDTSLLLEVFTGEQGRAALVAKGARRAGRGRCAPAAVLQPFQPLWLSSSGRGEVRTLTRAEPAGAALALVGERLYCGFYVNELILRLLARGDPHEALFAFYQQALAALVDREPELTLRRFELRLLEELGYAPDLIRDARMAPIVPERVYGYHPSTGLLPLPPQRGELGGDVAAVVEGTALAALARGEPPAPEAMPALRGLMRAALAPHLGDKPLASRALFRRPEPPPRTAP